ncbi:hypothetical protein K439DRAFT_1664701 [Ramaria rubella]|nr:hypothetical protein K439DRAFT_1664701 [Ramaria rubella]
MSGQQTSLPIPSPSGVPRAPTNIETPVKAKQVSTPQYRSGDLEKGRVSVLRDLGGSVEEVSVEWFIDKILPRVDIDTAAVLTSLRNQGYIQGGRWSFFPQNPIASARSEQEIFQPFESVVRSIVKCAKTTSHCNPVLEFFDNPNRAPTSSRANETRPDSYFVRAGSNCPDAPRTSRSRAPLHHWNDIALSAEYKKGVTPADKDDNVRKIIWSMHHIMRSDPCRRFTCGITVEDTQMRIWFACRTKVYVTTSFNFIQAHEKLVRFVIACSYAKEVDLGWDPTIKRVYVAGVEQYDITVHDVAGQAIFRTTKVLSDFGADGLRGRGTRVFEACRLNDGVPDGTSVAIKDVWVDDDRPKEGQVRQDIENEVANNDGDKARAHKYFLTVLHHGNVMIDGQVDNTRTLILRGDAPPSISQFRLNLQEGPLVYREPSIGATPLGPSMARAQHTDLAYSHKDHYRIVFKEVGQPVHNMTRLDDTFQALVDATNGLELMHKHGWVHRDISSGNLLVHEGVGKLTDLEYTKRMSTEGSHSEVRTQYQGTIDYMSLEAAQRTYLFSTGLAQNGNPWEKNQVVIIPRPWRYNPLHDLESLWWICVWMILFHRTGSSEPDDQELELAWKQYRVHQEIFPGTLKSSTSRTVALMSNGRLINLLWDISIPESCGLAAWQLENVRIKLLDRYHQAERGTTIDTTAFAGIHQEFVQAFETARGSSGDTKLRSLAVILSGKKREREEEKKHGKSNIDGAVRKP